MENTEKKNHNADEMRAKELWTKKKQQKGAEERKREQTPHILIWGQELLGHFWASYSID